MIRMVVMMAVPFVFVFIVSMPARHGADGQE